MVESTKLRAAEYMLAAQKTLDQPSTEEFMLLADGNDLNPTMLMRWQLSLARCAGLTSRFLPSGTLAGTCQSESSSNLRLG